MLEKNFGGYLDKDYFSEKSDYIVFKEFLATLDDIKPVYIKRSEFNKKQGNIIEKQDGESYNLYLPLDLKIYELPSIIYRINKLSFGDNLPSFASINELKIKLIILLNFLFNQLKQEDKLNNKYKKAINKVIKLYQGLFGLEEASKLNDQNYREKLINGINNDNKYIDYKRKITQIETKENLELLEEEINNILGEEFKTHFLEAFFENGVNKLRLSLSIITQQEQLKIKEKRTRFERIVYLTKTKNLEEQEILLRKKLKISKYKQELKELREKGNKNNINNKELEITKNILLEINKYPYQVTSNLFGYKPLNIINQKEIYCVGYALLGHAFLSELGIKHYGLDIEGHSALEVIIGGQSYYFDGAMKNTRLFKMKWNSRGLKYNEFEYGNNKRIASRQNPEKELLNDILMNLASELGNSFLKNICLKILKNNPNNTDALFGLAISFTEKGNYKESINLLKYILEINPYYIGTYNLIGNNLHDLGKKDEAKKYFELEIKYCYELIEKRINIIKAYFSISSSLKALGKIEEVFKIYNKIIEKDPGNLIAYFSMGDLLEALNDYDKAIIMYNKILEKDPNDTICLYRKAYILYKQKHYLEAINVYNQIIKIEKETTNAYFFIGNILYKEKKWKEALSYYQKFLKKHPKNLNTKINIVDTYFELGEDKKAYLLVEEILEENKETNPNIYTKLGNNLYSYEKYEKAIILYKKDLEINGDNYNSFKYIGNSLYVLGKHKEAIDFYKKTLTIQAYDSSTYKFLGELLKTLGYNKESDLFLYVSKKIIGIKINNIESNINKDIIDNYLKEKEYKKLREFMFKFLRI